MLKVEADNSLDLSHVSAFREPEFIFLNKLFEKHGFQVRVAGGAVRDVLMSVDPKDVDLATTATPEQMIEMFTQENIRMLNRNGEAHGTVTVRINDKVCQLHVIPPVNCATLVWSSLPSYVLFIRTLLHNFKHEHFE
ncbi:unnamed protein product [Dibothriocephalus latus]|uniref:Poly A polymerase head domain-containing protein n=1 Tax=Dibothriocephalus latus TaxID=60516 RepID=A0A3P7MV70_DIBLA|nr:unnamed protein product [Dibothriocephalus latus]